MAAAQGGSMRHLIVLALVLGGCIDDGVPDFDPSSVSPLSDKADEFTDATRVVGTLAYGQTAVRAFPEAGFNGYTFKATAGDVISVYATGVPRVKGPNAVVLLYALDGSNRPGGEPLVWHDNVNAPTRLDAHIQDYSIATTGTYLLVVATADPTKRDGEYRLRLACTGGPCAPKWTTRANDSCQLSGVGKAVHAAVLTSKADQITIPVDKIVSTRNAIGPVLFQRAKQLYANPADMPYPTIFPAVADLIANAKYEVDVRTSETWSLDPNKDPTDAELYADDPLQEILDGVARLENRLRKEKRHGNPVVVRWIADTFEWDYYRTAKVLYRFFAPLQLDPQLVKLEIVTYSHGSAHEDHSKVIVVDGAYVHTGGANPHPNNNYEHPEHDTAYVFKGQIAQAALADFAFFWRNDNSLLWSCKPKDDRGGISCRETFPPVLVHRREVLAPDWDKLGLPTNACLPMIYLGKKGEDNPFSNAIDNPIAQGYLGAISAATELVRIESPNLNDDAVMQRVLAGLMRTPTVRTQIVLPPNRNAKKAGLPTGGGTTESKMAKLYEMIAQSLAARTDRATKEPEVRARYQFRWHPVLGDRPGAHHVKYMSVDHQLAIVGSTNMDTQSFNRARETSIAIDDAGVTCYLDSIVFLADFDISRKANAAFDDGQGIGTRCAAP